MSRIPPLAVEQLDEELQAIMQAGEQIMGFTSNDALVMARRPAILKAMLGLVQATYSEGAVSLELKKLIAVMTSSAAGCQYCQTHTLFGAMNEGVSSEKLNDIWMFQSSDLYSDAERAALEVARAAAMTPNETSDADFIRLQQHFDNEQIIEIVGVIALFGFLNRWNSTMATDIEQTPKAAVQARGLI